MLEFRQVQEPIVKWGLLPSIFFLIISLAATILLWNKLPSEIPLFYNKPWGKEQLASPYHIFLPFGLSIFFILTNIILFKASQEYPFLQKVFLLGTGITATLVAITILKILFLML